jgi:hypothetical protein
MQFLHTREWLDRNDRVKVNCDTQCNVTLMNDREFAAFERGDAHRYYGGFYEYFPVILAAPDAGHWNVVIDLAGGSANIRYSIAVIKG